MNGDNNVHGESSVLFCDSAMALISVALVDTRRISPCSLGINRAVKKAFFYNFFHSPMFFLFCGDIRLPVLEFAGSETSKVCRFFLLCPLMFLVCSCYTLLFYNYIIL